MSPSPFTILLSLSRDKHYELFSPPQRYLNMYAAGIIMHGLQKAIIHKLFAHLRDAEALLISCWLLILIFNFHCLVLSMIFVEPLLRLLHLRLVFGFIKIIIKLPRIGFAWILIGYAVKSMRRVWRAWEKLTVCMSAYNSKTFGTRVTKLGDNVPSFITQVELD